MTSQSQDDLICGRLTINRSKNRSRSNTLKDCHRCEGAGDDQNEFNVRADHGTRMPKIGLQHSISERTLGARSWVVSALLDTPATIDRDANLGSVINMGDRIEHLFFTAIQMMFTLFSNGRFVEV